MTHAVPPLPAPRPVNGVVYRMNAAEQFKEFASRFRPRERLSPDHQLIRAAPVGNCLAPLKRGVIDVYDPGVPADHGDIVLVQMQPEQYADIYARNSHKPEWSAIYGTTPGHGWVTKFLASLGGRHYLLTNRSCFPLGDNQILGTLVGCEDWCGNPVMPTFCINANAATVVESSEDDSVSLTNGGGVVLSHSFTPIGHSYLLQVTASLNVWITGGSGTPEFYITVNGNSTTLADSQKSTPSATTSPGQRITLQVEVPIVPANEGGAGLFAQVVWTGMQPSGTAEARGVSLRVEAIKR